jgi:hypothetical protein
VTLDESHSLLRVHNHSAVLIDQRAVGFNSSLACRLLPRRQSVRRLLGLSPGFPREVFKGLDQSGARLLSPDYPATPRRSIEQRPNCLFDLHVALQELPWAKIATFHRTRARQASAFRFSSALAEQFLRANDASATNDAVAGSRPGRAVR